MITRGNAIAKIYTLSDVLGNVFYVGCTIGSLEQRLKNHLSDSKGQLRRFMNQEKNTKIRALEYKILIKEVDRMEVSGWKGYQMNCQARPLEYKWIIKFHKAGANLTNRTDLDRIKKRNLFEMEDKLITN